MVRVAKLVQELQVVSVVRMISLDDIYIQKIYSFHGQNHQIIEKS